MSIIDQNSDANMQDLRERGQQKDHNITFLQV